MKELQDRRKVAQYGNQSTHKKKLWQSFLKWLKLDNSQATLNISYITSKSKQHQNKGWDTKSVQALKHQETPYFSVDFQDFWTTASLEYVLIGSNFDFHPTWLEVVKILLFPLAAAGYFFALLSSLFGQVRSACSPCMRRAFLWLQSQPFSILSLFLCKLTHITNESASVSSSLSLCQTFFLSRVCSTDLDWQRLLCYKGREERATKTQRRASNIQKL